MPLYEYQCEPCGHRFEAIQKFSDRPLETCPKCGGPVRKLIAAPAFQFKGSGWYVTDYAKKDSAAAGGTDGPKETTPAKVEPTASAEKSVEKSGEKRGEKSSAASDGTSPTKT